MIDKIVIIGSGNVATILGMALKKQKKQIIQVYSRNIENAKTCAEILNAKYSDDIKKLNPNADIYIIATKDSAIPDICKQIKSKALVVHTSGTVSMEELSSCSPNYGVIYPLQSIVKEKKINFRKRVPLLIEANNKNNLSIIKELCLKIADNVYDVKTSERKLIHLTAVILNNFSTYLFISAKNFIKSENINFDLFQPLIKQTYKQFGKNKTIILTGPATRNDTKTIKEHKQLLEHNPELLKIYNTFTDIIKNSINKN